MGGKHILLGVTGGIAAYKSAELVRRLREAGAEVRVVLTRAGAEFVTPLTFQALSGQTVFDGSPEKTAPESAMEHIELARWADAILVAPATAHTLARLSHGLADDLLTTICLASDAPLAVAPAMNRRMWNNKITQSNIDRLRTCGVHLFGPAEGEQACGEWGTGRMLEPEVLIQRLAGLFKTPLLAGLRIVVTAGPTLEDIDPVRYLGNRSSGKMGYAVASAAVGAGAEVVLVSGVTSLARPDGVAFVKVRSAGEMHNEVMRRMTNCDIFIAAAAVADYRPAARIDRKIKKNDAPLALELVPNPDILAEVARLANGPFCVGFAAETERLAEHAEAKRVAKGVDMIAANQVGRPGIGFESDENALEVFWSGGRATLPRSSKTEVAHRLIELIGQRYNSAS